MIEIIGKAVDEVMDKTACESIFWPALQQDFAGQEAHTRGERSYAGSGPVI